MTIVVGVDGSATSQHGLTWAMGEARIRHQPLRLVHATVLVRSGSESMTLPRLVADAAQSLIDRELAIVRAAAPDLEITAALVQGPAALGLIEASVDADLLVVGSHGRRVVPSFVLGSVADACVRHADVPVAVVRFEAVEHPGGAIVVGTDGSDPSLAALRWARGEAAARRVPLRVVHAWEPGCSTELAAIAVGVAEEIEHDARCTLDHSIAVTDDEGGSEPEAVLAHASAAHALLDASADASLLVVGSRGRGGFAGLLLGSVSRRCAHEARCPVVVVRG